MSEPQTQMSEYNPDLTAINLRNYISPNPDQVLDNVLENVLAFLTSKRDRNTVSLVCKSWYRVEALTRSELIVGNCYAVSPHRVVNRFKDIRSLVLKGKPRFADFSLLPPDWGAHFTPWVVVLGDAYRGLEKLCLKRMCVSDNDLSIVAHSFSGFKEIAIVCCDGFGTSGLAILVGKCRLVCETMCLDIIEVFNVVWVC